MLYKTINGVIIKKPIAFVGTLKIFILEAPVTAIVATIHTRL